MLDIDLEVKIIYWDGVKESVEIVHQDPISVIDYLLCLCRQGVGFEYEVTDIIL